jgi:hypothetical protein
MNTQNFNQSNGFPLETETLDEMQKAYLFMQHFGHLAGNYSIISGCEVANGIVQNGAIFVAGELLEFKGSSLGTDVIIVQTITKNEFENATEKDVLTKRHATFGVGLNSIPWANFKRFKNIVELTTDKAEQTTIDLLLQRILNLEARPAANVPIGFVGIWGLPAIAIPQGWTPHIPLKGRSAIGVDVDYDSNTSGDLINYNFNVLGYQGGTREHALTIDQMPRFRLKLENAMPKIMADTDRGSNTSAFSMDTPVDAFTEFIGNEEAHTNMPPYTIVQYIRYVG